LAAHAEITGGEIRNIVLSAVHDVLLADTAFGMRHLLTATAREYDKLGRRLPSQLASSQLVGSVNRSEVRGES
jgi:hypothetical protein